MKGLVTLQMLEEHYEPHKPAKRPEPVPRPGIKVVLSVLATLACLILGAISALAAKDAWVSGDVPENAHTTTYLVRPGDSAWSIASNDTAYGTGQVEQWIEDRYGEVLQPGEVITVPVQPR